jgi:hypothetical protein
MRFTAYVFGMTQTGTVEVSIAAGVVYDAAGNESEVFPSTEVAYKPWHNVGSPLDVNGDGVVSALDALIVINCINTHLENCCLPPVTPPVIPPGTQPLPFRAGPPFPDVNGDDFCTPQDVLAVINYINAQADCDGGTPGAVLESGDGTSSVAMAVLGGVWPSVPVDGAEGEGPASDALTPADKQERPTATVVASRDFRRLFVAPDPQPRTNGGGSAEDEAPEDNLREIDLDDVLSAIAEDVARSWS